MKRKRMLISIAMATIVLVAMGVVADVSAAKPAMSAPIIPSAPPSLLRLTLHYTPALYGNDQFIFARGYDNALWYMHNGVPWKSLYGQITADPAALFKVKKWQLA